MRHTLRIIMITFIVLGLFCIFLLVSGLIDLKEGKAYKARCTATTEGTVTYFYSREEREYYLSKHYSDSGDTSISYKFYANSLEYSGHRSYGEYFSDMQYSEGDRITIHYNPDAPYENYPDNHCYHVVAAKKRLEIVAIAWSIYLVFLIIFIVCGRRHS